MKQIITTLLLLFSLTLSAQTVDVVGPKKKQQTTAVDVNKRKAEADAAAKKRAAEEAAAKKRAEQSAANKKAEQARQEKLRQEREEQARQEKLRREQEEKEKLIILENSISKDYMVDLGLSVLWANCNLGANSPEQSGDNYAWGEKLPKSSYTENNYTIRFSSKKSIDISQTDYDIANKILNKSWHIPTKKELQELTTKCHRTANFTFKGVKGDVWTGPNGVSIFIPYTSNQTYSLWTSESRDNIGKDVYRYTSSTNSIGTTFMYQGLQIRPVCAWIEKELQAKENEKYVDLGLSVKWMNCNIGAESPTEIGTKTIWADNTGHYVLPSKYRFYKDYDRIPQKNIPLNICGNEDYDIVTKTFGKGYRLPSSDELKELINECQWEKCEYGRQTVYKVTGPNRNFIFIPCSDYSRGPVFYGWQLTPIEIAEIKFMNDVVSLMSGELTGEKSRRYVIALSVKRQERSDRLPIRGVYDGN